MKQYTYYTNTNVGKIKDDLKETIDFYNICPNRSRTQLRGRYIITVPTFLAQEFAIFLSGALSTSQSVIIGGR